LFCAGIVGTGLLAVPILAGSAAYAVAEGFGWRIGLGRQLLRARGFYAILASATLAGVALNFTPIDPIKALFWSAVINGVIAVPVMAVIMLMAAKSDVMGQFAIKRPIKVMGWTATAVMALAVLGMVVTWGT
jgi:Mn2+/Fe2+ NRAMP family transporter